MNNDTNPSTNGTPTDVPARMFGLPLDHPLDREPAAGMVEAVEMWRIALLHVGVLGGWDRRITAWLAGKGPDVVATVAAWLHRARQAGVVAGRREALDEAGDRDTDVHVLAADIERLADHADTQLAEGEAGAQEVLEELLDAVRTRVSMDVPHAEVLAEVATRARRRYFTVLGGRLESDQRQLALCVAVETARTSFLGDSDLAAAVRAIVDADRQVDEAIGDLGLVGDDQPAGPVRSVVLPPEVARRLCDFLESDGHRVLWAHRSEDLMVDVRLSPADVVVLQIGEWDADAVITEDWQLAVGGGADRYEVTVGWPRRPDDGGDALVDEVRGYGAEGQDPADEGHSTPLAAAGLAAGVLGVAGLVATHSGSPGLGLVLAAVGGITGVVVLALVRRGRDGGAS